MTDTNTAPTATPIPSSPAPKPAPKPGWKTSEAWITLIVIVLGALPSSGLLPATGDAVKIVGLCLTVAAALGYTGSRTMLKNAAMLVLLVGLAHTATGCATGREKAIRTTLITTDAAKAAFVAFDRQHQLDLVAQAPDRAAGEAALVAWRAKQAEAEKAFEVTYRGIAAAATLNDDPSFNGMVQAAALLAAELKTLGVTK